MPSLQQQIEQAKTLLTLDQLPAMPKEILRLNKLLSGMDVPEVKEVVQLISQNINLTAEVIRTANTPMFSKNRVTQIISIRDAVDVLGLKSLKNLVMGIYYSMEYLGRARAEINHLSLNTASLCALLSHRVLSIHAEEAYLAGLFHNVGAMLMANTFKDYDQVFVDTLSMPFQIKNIEEETYHVSRRIAGLLLAKQWQLGKQMGHIIYQAHKQTLTEIENGKIRLLVALVQLSEACIIKSEYPGYASEEVEQMYHSANQELMIDEEDILEAMNYLFPHPGELV